jgi:DNA-binding NtrC family response regulator
MPTPLVVAMSGTALPEQAFELAQLGVRRFLPKPLDLPSLEAVLAEAVRNPPELEHQWRGLVGQRPIRDVEREMRRAMVQEAMAKSGGRLSKAARLLAVSRQLLQYMLRKP